jgi:hypothetical protein
MLILFLGNIWIDLPLPSLIYALKGYQVQERYFEYSYPIFLESQQTVYLSYFYNNVHTSYHLCGHTLQTYLTVLLSFEPSRPLPVLMTMMNHHGSLRLLGLSHLDIKVQNQKVCCILVVEYTFFQNVF